MRVEVIYGEHALTPGFAESCVGYTFETDLPLEVGDLVLVPGKWTRDSKPQKATVVKVGSSYSGEVRKVLRRYEKTPA